MLIDFRLPRGTRRWSLSCGIAPYSHRRRATRTLSWSSHNGVDFGFRPVELGVQFQTDGSAPLTPDAEGFAGALAQVLVPVAEAARDGSWERVKACRADDCKWAFYDRSRNRSGVWCDMAVCGNRAKVRAYRSRGAGGD